MSTTFGSFCRERRLELRLSLREFCRQAAIDPSQWSRIERGRLPLPIDRIGEIARVLKVNRGPSYRRFRDLAHLSRSAVPPDIMADSELVGLLPAIICGLRDPEKLRQLAEVIRSNA